MARVRSNRLQGVTFDLMRHYAVGELGEVAWAGILTGVGARAKSTRSESPTRMRSSHRSR